MKRPKYEVQIFYDNNEQPQWFSDIIEHALPLVGFGRLVSEIDGNIRTYGINMQRVRFWSIREVEQNDER